jgi:di/tricarboxylate transporter
MLLTLAAAVVLFSWDRLPADATALGILLFLILTGLLPAERAFAGFGSEVVVMMLGLLILMAALAQTGVTDMAARALMGRTNSDYKQILLWVMVAAVLVGAFMSNTAATAFFLPIVVGIAQRAKISSAKLLMPLAFASVLASSITLISTSTNLLVSAVMKDLGLTTMGMFELTPVGVPIALAGVLYMLILGHRLVPDRMPAEEGGLMSTRLFLSEMIITEDSSLIDKTLAESGLGRDLDLTVLEIHRATGTTLVPKPETRLFEGDSLLVEGERESILGVKGLSGIEIKPEARRPVSALDHERVVLTEVIVVPASPLIGRTLEGLRFRQLYGLQVLAISRQGERLMRKLSRIRLRMGDVMVIQGERDQISALDRSNTFRILGTAEQRPANRRRAQVALAVFAGVLIASALAILDLPVATLLGAVLVFVTRCITPEEAYRRVNWHALIVIACMLGLGAAMEITGTAAFLASQAVRLVGQAQPVLILSAFFALTLVLTQPMSNQAAAVVVLPVAIRTATGLGLNPRSFAMMVTLAASCSFLTPLEPACLLVYGPGRYRFTDFVRVGLLPTVSSYLIAVALVPAIWPL